MKKKQRQKRFRFNVINLKLLSVDRAGVTAYENIFNHLVDKRVHVPVRGGKHVIVRTKFKIDLNEMSCYHGKIAKFTKLESNDWININNMEVENVNIPPNKFPNLTETDYIFIPELHRFAILINTALSVKNALTFWTEGVKQVIDSKEEMQFIVEQSKDVFDEILNAKSIKRIKLEVTPTNDDIEEEALEFMDDELKEMQASMIKMQITPNQHDELSMKSQVLNGLLGLARSNGEAEAIVINEQDERKKIITKQHPNIYEFVSKNYEDAQDSLVGELKRIYRDGRRE